METTAQAAAWRCFARSPTLERKPRPCSMCNNLLAQGLERHSYRLFSRKASHGCLIACFWVLRFYLSVPEQGWCRRLLLGSLPSSSTSLSIQPWPGGASVSTSQPPTAVEANGPVQELVSCPVRLRSGLSQGEETLQPHTPVSFQAWVIILKERCKRIQKEL